MGKQTGLGDNLYVGGYDLSGDIGSVGHIGGGPAALEVTGINKEAFERIGGVRDGGIDIQSFFNPDAGQAHPVLSALPTADVLVSYLRGTTLGNPAACLNAKQVNYDPTRAADGGLSIDVASLANEFGLEWGRMLTAGKRSDTGATNGTGVDFGASSAFGLQVYLHVFSFTGTDVIINVQESSDDGGGDAYANVTDANSAVISSAPYTERIATSDTQTIERWLRAVTMTSGGFSAMTFAVIVVKNETAVVF